MRNLYCSNVQYYVGIKFKWRASSILRHIFAESRSDSNKQKPTSTIFTSQIVDDESGFQPQIMPVMHNGLSAKENINNNQDSIFSKGKFQRSFVYL